MTDYNDDDQHHDPEVGRVAAEIEKLTQESKQYRKLDHWLPYPKQRQFLETGARFRERGFFAGSQLGKTETGAYEMACHLTGLYPPGWAGRRFTKPIKAWCVGENLKMVRDIMQKKLCGEPGAVEFFGSGMIPKHLFVGDPVMAKGEGGAFDTIQVRHVSGGVSTLRFRTYQAGRVALQGESLDFCWLDEEPKDFEVYTECLARITATNGCLIITFTPLLGMSAVSIRYRQEFSPDRTFVQMGIDDIPPAKGDAASADSAVEVYGHISVVDREKIVEGYPEHEREARSKGEPMLGEGRVYKTPEAEIIDEIDPYTAPAYWRWGAAMDIGISHPWAYAILCHDVDQDVIFVVAELRMADSTPSAHVAAIRNLEKRLFNWHMENFPVAWPHDAHSRERGSGEPIKNLYKQYGLRMMSEEATLPNLKGAAAYSLEGGVAEIDARERAGKWKVSRRCVCYLEERRLYHRKDGLIVPLRDDVLSAARYAYMMRRKFKTLDECRGIAGPGAPWPGGGPRGGGGGKPTTFAKGSSGHSGGHYDIFNP